MTYEERKDRYEVLKQLEKQYRSEYNYEGLVSVYNEYISLGTAWGEHGTILFKKMYCLVRLNRLDEVQRIWKENKVEVSFSMEQNKLYRATTLLSFFTDQQHTVFVINQTLLDWLKDTETSEQVKDIIFDYDSVLRQLAASIAAYKANYG